MTTPEISDLLAFYADQRRVRASLSFAEKIARVEKMRERDKALRLSRPSTACRPESPDSPTPPGKP